MGTSFPLVISFATPRYARELERLVKSLQRFAIDFQVEILPDRGSWERNCNRKAEFVLAWLERRRAPVLWLDADAEVVQQPVLFDGAYFEFAICDRPHLGFGSGTVYFDRDALGLARLWVELAGLHPTEWDQRLLQQAWHVLDVAGTAPATHWLPDTYLAKVDHPEGAVILHHQASRRLR